MTIEKLERVMWRLRKRNPGKNELKMLELRRAIIYEIGTDDRTFYKNRESLVALGWIKRRGKTISLTGADITGEA